MTAKKERPPGGAYTGTDTETSFHNVNYTTETRKAQEENARLDVAAYQTGDGNKVDSRSLSSHAHSIKIGGECQDKIARFNTNAGIFQQVKDTVNIPEAAALYGCPPNRAGFIRCPFHGGGNEKTPSCHLTERYFKCFACQEGGDVIKFTARLFDLSPLDAMKRLNTDFGLGLSLDRHAPTPEELAAARKRQEVRDAARLFTDWKARAEWSLTRAAGVGEGALLDGPPWTEAQITAIQWRGYWLYLCDLLSVGDESEQLAILRDWPNVGARLETVLTAKEVCA